MRDAFALDPRLSDCYIRIASTEDLKESRFDTILYIDVLEHIFDDQSELQRASAMLRAGGSLIVLSPAYGCLYTPFDRAIGHWRRYQKQTLEKAAPKECQLDTAIYLDSAGFWASAGNRLFLKQNMPTLRQIHFWDRYLVSISRVLDPLVLHSFGKSILAVWIKV